MERCSSECSPVLLIYQVTADSPPYEDLLISSSHFSPDRFVSYRGFRLDLSWAQVQKSSQLDIQRSKKSFPDLTALVESKSPD